MYSNYYYFRMNPVYLTIGTLIFWSIIVNSGRVEENREVEKFVLNKYERRHRPVKKESTTTNVKVFIVVNHIEEVVSIFAIPKFKNS